MATDTNKKSASSGEDSQAVSAVVTGDPVQSGDAHHLRPAFTGKTILIILGAIVVVAGLAAAKLHFGQKVYAQAAGHKIYKKDVENLLANSKAISVHDGATVLANKYLTEAMAKQQGITVSDKEIETAIGPNFQQTKNKYKYSYQLQVNGLYFDKLQTYNQGVYKGYLLVAHFDRNIDLQSKEGQIAGDPAAIASDKKYAQDFITNLYNQIKAGKITWDQAAEMEKQDPTLGMQMYPSLSHSGPFNTSESPVSLFEPDSAQQQLRTLKPGQTSKPFVVKVTNTVGSDNTTFESYFLVVKMDSSAGGKSSVNFDQAVIQAKKQLGYKVNV